MARRDRLRQTRRAGAKAKLAGKARDANPNAGDPDFKNAWWQGWDATDMPTKPPTKGTDQCP